MNGNEFTCPHCQQSCVAPPEALGQTVACPACKGLVTLPLAGQQPQVAEVAAPPALPSAPQLPQTCPLCGRSKRMGAARMLYGHPVCPKCYSAFANRRQLAYLLDILGYYLICVMIGIAIGLVLALTGSDANITNLLSHVVAISVLFVWFGKDCLAGQSVGKAICGVQVIDETTGAPGGILSSFKRNLPLLVPFMPLIVAFQLGKGHRTGDRWSNTKVIWKKYSDHPIFAPVRVQQ